MRGLVCRHPVIAVLLLFFVSVSIYAVCSALSYRIGRLWSSIVMDAVVALAAFLYMKYFTGFGEKKVSVNFWYIMTGILVVFLFYISMALTARVIYMLFRDVFYDAYMANRGEASMTSQVLALLTTTVGAPVSEELLFRGGIYGTLRKTRLPAFAAAFAGSFLFAVCHGTVVHIVPATLMGMLCCAVYECTGRLRCTMLLHCFYNVLSYVTKGMRVPDWLGTVPAVAIQCLLWLLLIAGVFAMYNVRDARETKTG